MINKNKKLTLNDLDLCIVDIETTGATSHSGRIIEIGAVKITKGKLVDQFHSLINPQQPIPASITEFTGITDEDVKNSPIFEDIHRRLLCFLEGHIFVAHNVVFDYGFIRQEFDRLGVVFNLERFCSVKLSRVLFPDEIKHDLSSIVERYGIPLKNRHRALDDALGVWEFFKIIEKQIGQKEQHAALSAVFKSPRLLPAGISTSIDHLPHALGVYRLYDANDALLYVGKANDIRSKVWDRIMVMPEVKRVDYIETQGKLGALLLESHWIKKYQPVFNRRYKPLNQMTLIYIEEDDLGYKNVKLETRHTVQKEDLQSAYTVFRTKKHALKFLEGISKKYRIDKTSQKPVVHNMRLIEALSKHRKINWPFSRPIAIEENNALKTKGEVFVIDRWIIQQATTYENEMNNSLFEADGIFDFDTYRVLFNYLRRNNKVKVIFL